MSKFVFCVDIGGTKTACAVYDEDGKEIFYDCQPTLPEKGLDDLIDRIAARTCGKLKNVSYGVIACPGPLDIPNGKIIYIATTGWKDLPVVEKFEKKFSFPFALLNDCNAGALGAYALYARESSSVVYISVSTGIGGGAVLDGKLYNGKGNAAEIGHLPVVGSGLHCACGKADCLELYASGKGIENRYYDKTGDKKSCSEIVSMAKNGDKTAKEIFTKARKALAFAIRSVVAAFDPEVVVFGGSVCKAKEMFFGEAIDYLHGCGTGIRFAKEDGKQVLYGGYLYFATNR